MPLRPGWLVTGFVLAMLVPAAVLLWLAARFLEQDRILQEAQTRERQELAADRTVAQMEQAVSASEGLLNRPEGFQADDAVIVTLEQSRATGYPRRNLLFHPSKSAWLETARVFDNAERAEFQEQDLPKAAAAYRALAREATTAIRAGALLGLARTLRKAGQEKEAMDAYAELSGYRDIRINGVPADLIAMRARRETRGLAAGLLSGNWEIDRAAFISYSEEIGLKPDPERLALSSAVEWLSSQQQPSGRMAKELEGVPIVMLWNTSQGQRRALIAGPGYQARHWLRSLDRSRISLNGAKAPNSVLRTAAATGLPWSITVKPGDVLRPEARRTFLTAALGILSLAVLATAALLAMVLSRELAVARLKSDFVAAVSHEFRTPLTTLRQYNEMLLEQDDLSTGERGVYLEAQQRAIGRLHGMVDSLLDFRRMEARAWKYRMEALDVGALASAVVEEFGRETTGHGFTISCRADLPAASICGDPEALRRALWNLLDNAMKYSGQARAIEVEVGRENQHVKVSVRDHGCGIPKADQKRIFGKFIRGRNVSRSGIQGTGLGLAMVRHITAAHGGRVELTSEPERGSTFTIVLPCKEVPCSES